MKNNLSKIFVFILLNGLVHISIAQTSSSSNTGDNICGTPVLNDSLTQIALENTKFLDPATYRLMIKKHQERTLAKTQVDTLGSIKSFFTYNFVTKSYNTVYAKLLRKGTRIQIWVDTTELANNHASQGVADTLLNSLENKTPSVSRDSTKGIVKLDEQYFGNQPNKDGDNLTDFLVFDIKDSYNGTTVQAFTAGYFDPNDQKDIENSNKKDLLYIDSYPGIFNGGTRNATWPLATLAHEYQHLIHYNYDKKEVSFVNEGLSEVASVICGYPLRSPQGYFNQTNIPLFNWNTNVNNKDVLADYSRAALFTLYYYEQLGDSVLKKVVQDTLVGINGYNKAFNSYGKNFDEIFRNFAIANIYQLKSQNSLYGYSYSISGWPLVNYIQKPNTVAGNISIYDHAVKYTTVKSLTDTVKIKLSSSNSNVKGNISVSKPWLFPQVDSLILDSNYTLADFSVDVDSAQSIILNLDTVKTTFNLEVSGKDNNQYWTRTSYTNDNPYFMIVYDDKNRFYMISAVGLMFSTDLPFNTINSVYTDGYFSRITSNIFVHKDSLFVGTLYGEIFTSGDSGKTWSNIPTPVFNQTDYISYINIDPFNNYYIANFKHNSLFWLSTNKGQTWRNLDNNNIFNTFYKRGISIITDGFGNVYATTDHNELYFSNNMGNSWSLVDDSWVRFLSFLRNDNSYYVYTWTINNGLFKIDPDDISKPIPLGVPKDWKVRDIAFHPSKDSIMMIAVDYNPNFPERGGGVYLSNDKGNTWQKINNGLEDIAAYSVGIDKNGNAIASTSTAIHRLNNSLTDVKELTNLIPTNFVLSQNYPNPFNPSTIISYQISAISKVSLKVYDVFGSEVATLVNKVQPAGNYNINFDASRLSSGVYFYRIIAGDFIQTKKMILLK